MSTIHGYDAGVYRPDFELDFLSNHPGTEGLSSVLYDVEVITEEEALVRESRLDLTEHDLIDPKTTLGTVVSFEQDDPISEQGETLPDGVQVYEIRVKDPYVEADPKSYWRVSEYVRHLEGMMARSGFDPLQGARSEAQSQAEWNKYTSAWLADPNVEGLAAWRDKVPNGDALQDLYDIPVGKVLGTVDGREITASKETAAQLRFVDDAVAIRDRRAAMIEIAATYIPGINLTSGKLNWLSLASGTADPSIRALVRARDDLGIVPNLVVADIDEDSLKQVTEIAAKNGLAEEQVRVLRTNILSPKLKESLLRRAQLDKFEIVENLGFEEYLPQSGDPLEARKGLGLPQASEFTRSAFELVADGGVLISGNMVLDRPQKNFVFGTVDWPIINARSEAAIMRVYKEAGILDDPRAEVAMFRVVNDTTEAHLYNIVAVYKKPAPDTLDTVASA